MLSSRVTGSLWGHREDLRFLESMWCHVLEERCNDQGASWGRGDRSVLNLYNSHQNFCAVLKRDCNLLTFMLAEQCRTDGGDRTHHFDAFAGALFFDMSDEVHLGIISIVAFKQNGDPRQDSYLTHWWSSCDLGTFQDGEQQVLTVIELAVLVFSGVVVAVFLEIAHLAGNANEVGNTRKFVVLKVGDLGLEPFVGLC